MASLPTPVLSSIGARQVTLRRFRHPYFEAYCNNCSWVSFTYPTEDEAVDRAESHAERCCERINQMLAMQVAVVEKFAQNLAMGDEVLLKSLNVLTVENVAEVDEMIWVTYSMGEFQSEILELPYNHIVKVLHD